MKIIYGSGKLSGSNIRLGHFLRYTSHDVRVAAYYKNHTYLSNIHWCLDSLKSSSNKNSGKIEEIIGVPLNLDYEKLMRMIDDITEEDPDLILSDYEFVTAYISKAIDVPLISCTPLHLIDGVDWNTNKKNLFFNESRMLKVFDSAIEKLIYSPFGCLEDSPTIDDEFKWVKPYPEELKNYSRNISQIKNSVQSMGGAFTTGESSDIFYQLLTGKKICCADSPEDIECRLNGVFVDSLNLGMSIGQAEFNMSYASAKLDIFNSSNFNYLINKEVQYLHETLEL